MSFISPSIWTGFIYSVCSLGWGHFVFWKRARPAARSKHFGGDGSQSVSSPHQKCGAASGQELWVGKNTPWKLTWESKCGNLAKSSLDMLLITLAVSHLLLEEKLYIWWERKGRRKKDKEEERKGNQCLVFIQGVTLFYKHCHLNIQNSFILGVWVQKCSWCQLDSASML